MTCVGPMFMGWRKNPKPLYHLARHKYQKDNAKEPVDFPQALNASQIHPPSD